MTTHAQHHITEGDELLTVRLEGSLQPESIPAFEADLSTLVRPTHHVVIVCGRLSEISRAWVRPLVHLSKELQKLNRKLRFVEANPSIAAFFLKEGVEKLLVIKGTLREAQADMGMISKKALDVGFVNPFIDATVKVLGTQANTKSTAGKIYVRKRGEKFSGDISGVIGLVCDAFNGSVVISFPEKTFLEIVSRIFGEKHLTITREIEDGAAELTNIIFGQAKIVLNERGYGIKTALPSVVTGKDHSVVPASQGAVVVVPFESDAGAFFIEITTSF